jgi:hypothetical protein
MVHTLHRVKVVGSQPLKSFKDLFTKEEFKRCSQSLHNGKTWFKLKTNVIVAFLCWVIFRLYHSCYVLLVIIQTYLEGSCLVIFCASLLILVPPSYLHQEIAEASSEAAKKYYEETPIDKESASGVTAVMRAAAKSKHQPFKGQFLKYIVVANPNWEMNSFRKSMFLNFILANISSSTIGQ